MIWFCSWLTGTPQFGFFCFSSPPFSCYLEWPVCLQRPSLRRRSELSAWEPTLFTKLATRGCCQNGEAELTSPEASLLFLQPVNFVKLPIQVSKLRSHSPACSQWARSRPQPWQPAITLNLDKIQDWRLRLGCFSLSASKLLLIPPSHAEWKASWSMLESVRRESPSCIWTLSDLGSTRMEFCGFGEALPQCGLSTRVPMQTARGHVRSSIDANAQSCSSLSFFFFFLRLHLWQFQD
jgi:hypothetical protein